MCGIAIEVDGDRITSVRGDPRDPFSRGYICPKALALQDVHEDGDRLRHPVRRVGSGFQRISWDEALDEVAGRLRETQARHGRDAVAVYLGNPTVHNYASLLYLIPFLEVLRTRSRFSSTSVDQLPHHVVGTLLFGHQLLVPVPDLDRTAFTRSRSGTPRSTRPRCSPRRTARAAGREGVQLGTARRHAGESVNDLTDHLAVDALSGTAALNGVPVRVEPIEAAQA